MTIPAVCHHCAGRFGVPVMAAPAKCPHCQRRLDAFDPGHVIRGIACSGGCVAHLAVTFEPVEGKRPIDARCPVCQESWHFSRILLHEEVPYEPIISIDLG